MSTQPQKLSHHVNGHGTWIRSLTVIESNMAVERFFQFYRGQWVYFKRVVHSVH